MLYQWTFQLYEYLNLRLDGSQVEKLWILDSLPRLRRFINI